MNSIIVSCWSAIKVENLVLSECYKMELDSYVTRHFYRCYRKPPVGMYALDLLPAPPKTYSSNSIIITCGQFMKWFVSHQRHFHNVWWSVEVKGRIKTLVFYRCHWRQPVSNTPSITSALLPQRIASTNLQTRKGWIARHYMYVHILLTVIKRLNPKA